MCSARPEVTSLRVKALARLMGAGPAHYQSVFAELYRRFWVASNKFIPMEQYEGVFGFLEEWREEVGEGDTGGEVFIPFRKRNYGDE
jgi:hypothetical protein